VARRHTAFTSRIGVCTASCEPGIFLRGRVPARCVLLAMPLSSPRAARNRGAEFNSDAMVVAYHGEGLDFRTMDPLAIFVVIVDRDLLEQHATALLGCTLESLRRDQQVAFEAADLKRRRLRALTTGIRHALEHDPGQLCRGFSAERFESTILSAMLEGCACGPTVHVSATRRRQLAIATESFIRENLNSVLTIAALCKAMRVPERTLHLAFKEHFATTPKAHLKMLRLNSVRRELRRSCGLATVTETAMKWGFWHLGWFAHDYREMFGESATDTLRQCGLAVSG
jgi:AraC family ethanolamine operon transcriptional activator